jgi:hypothetical protein
MTYTVLTTEWCLFTVEQARNFPPDAIASRCEWHNYGHHAYDGMIRARITTNDSACDAYDVIRARRALRLSVAHSKHRTQGRIPEMSGSDYMRLVRAVQVRLASQSDHGRDGRHAFTACPACHIHVCMSHHDCRRAA